MTRRQQTKTSMARLTARAERMITRSVIGGIPFVRDFFPNWFMGILIWPRPGVCNTSGG